jgi:hypothetical protein
VNVHEWTPLTRDWVRIEDVTVDGAPVQLAELDVALVPPRARIDGDTVWVPSAAHPTDGVPAVLIAGEDADPASAQLINGPRDLHGRVTKAGTVVVAKLARITYR